MPPRLGSALLVAMVAIGSCGYYDDEPTRSGGPNAPAFETAAVVIETGDEPVLVNAEVAQTPRQRQHGLMNRADLDAGAGMIFIFFEPSTTGFWMKNTLVPLSIAYFGRNGEILRILDMKPCKEDPCPSYEPGVTYYGALEVNQGAFTEWGVEEGDIVRMNQ